MKVNLYERFAKESYVNSRDHGFWENKEQRNKAEMVMLMIGELAECQEAHRSGKHNPKFLAFEETIIPEFQDDPFYFAIWYKDQVKGCTGEELADVVIRVYDFVVGWEIDYKESRYHPSTSGNFSEDLLKIDKMITASSTYGNWNNVIPSIEQFAEDWEIDLPYHIEMKQRYNRTRPHLHGKLY